MRLPSPGFLLRAFLQVCQRFPGTMLSAAVGVVAVMILIDSNYNSGIEDDVLGRVWLTAQLGLALLTGIVAFTESRNWSAQRILLAQGVGILALLAYGAHLIFQLDRARFEYLHLPRFFLLALVAHLFVSVAPYLNRRSVADFWEYNRLLFANFVVGATFTFILFAGLSLAIVALNQLFNLDIDGRIYGRLFVLLAGIFNTSYFLYHFPKQYEFEAQDASYNVVFRNLCKYILIPIVVLYFLILYAYSAKIIGLWSLPRGFVGSLVIGFSVAGIFTYLLNYYLPDFDNSKIVHLYHRWFWPVLLPLTVLLFAAVFKRVGDYGFTEPRYVVLLTGIWLAGACVYFLLSKTDDIKFIPISLGAVALVAAVGPLSTFAVAERSQAALLEKLLSRNERWANGSLKQGTAPMLQEEISQATSILDFFERRGLLEDAAWLPMPIDSFPSVSTAYFQHERVARWLGFRSAVAQEILINISDEDQQSKTEIGGYSRHFPLYTERAQNNEPENGQFFKASTDGKKLVWLLAKNGTATPLDSFYLLPTLQSWANRVTDDVTSLQLKEPDNTIDLATRKASVRIRVNNAQVLKDSSGLRLNYLNGQLFLKEK